MSEGGACHRDSATATAPAARRGKRCGVKGGGAGPALLRPRPRPPSRIRPMPSTNPPWPSSKRRARASYRLVAFQYHPSASGFLSSYHWLPLLSALTRVSTLGNPKKKRPAHETKTGLFNVITSQCFDVALKPIRTALVRIPSELHLPTHAINYLIPISHRNSIRFPE